MKSRKIKSYLTLLLLLLPISAFAGGDLDIDALAKEAEAKQNQEAVPQEPMTVAKSPLAGTSWKLVKIMSMDDTESVPEDPSKYTITFHKNGSVNLKVDCNLGTGKWKTQSSGHVEFGPIATTRAMCPPGSLHDDYLSQFEWVRSYVLKEGRLYLNTMADGSIVEFAPLSQ